MRTTTLIRAFATTLLLITSGLIRAQEVLTNQQIIQMAQLGMGDAIIVSQVESSTNTFDVSTPALMELKKAGLSDEVLAKVIAAARNVSLRAMDPNDPMAPHRPGIYYFDDSGTLVELLPTTTSESKDRGVLATRISYGIAKTKVVSQVSGTSARTQLSNARPFYFYFNQQTTSFDQNTIAYYGFQQATSPNEFTLAQLDVNKGVRELETGSRNHYTTEVGIDQRHGRGFTIEQIAPGIFKVIPTELAPGEYCFVYAGSAPHERAQLKVHDFGVGQIAARGMISGQ